MGFEVAVFERWQRIESPVKGIGGGGGEHQIAGNGDHR